MHTHLASTAAALLLATTHASPVAQTPSIPKLSSLQFPNGIDLTRIQPALSANPAAPIAIPLTTSNLAQNLTAGDFHRGTIPSTGNTTNTLVSRLNQPDPRYQYTDPNQWPWRISGRVNWVNSRVHCTGALVGPRHVLTARHCIPPNNAGFVFCPSYDNGPNPTFGCSQAIYYYFWNDNSGDENCSTKEDWTVFVIDRRYGDGLGWFSYEVPQIGDFSKRQFTYSGYADDKDGQRLWRQDNAYLPTGGNDFPQLTCGSTGPIWTDDNSAPGTSGSSLFKPGGVVWGVLHGGTTANSGLFETVWASGNNMVSTINKARNEYP